MRIVLIRPKEKQCDNKVRYANAKDAKRAMRGARAHWGGHWDWYRCPWCLHPLTGKASFHIGHKVREPGNKEEA